MSTKTQTVNDLSFVLDEGTTTSFWNVAPTGDWTSDNEIGRCHADDCVAYIQETGNQAVLGAVVRSMIAAGRYTGIEAGFSARIAALAIS
jgi:hypothetical protein